MLTHNPTPPAACSGTSNFEVLRLFQAPIDRTSCLWILILAISGVSQGNMWQTQRNSYVTVGANVISSLED
jgi:hypothetical protein